MTHPKRGDVVRARLDPIVGSEQAGERPVLVLSPDFVNERSPTIIVACITSKKTERIYRNEVLLERPEGGLRLRSKVLLAQIRTIDKRRLAGKFGSVSDETMTLVEDALRISLGMVPV